MDIFPPPGSQKKSEDVQPYISNPMTNTTASKLPDKNKSSTESPLPASKTKPEHRSTKSGGFSVSAMMLAARLAKNAKRKRLNRDSPGSLSRTSIASSTRSMTSRTSSRSGSIYTKSMKSMKSMKSTKNMSSNSTRSTNMERMASQIELTAVDKEQGKQSRKSGLGLLGDPTNLQQSSELDSSSTTKRIPRKSRKSSSRSQTFLAVKAAAQARDELEEISSTMRAGHTIPLKDALKSLYRVNR